MVIGRSRVSSFVFGAGWFVESAGTRPYGFQPARIQRSGGIGGSLEGEGQAGP